jgi:hypothetical protein
VTAQVCLKVLAIELGSMFRVRVRAHIGDKLDVRLPQKIDEAAELVIRVSDRPKYGRGHHDAISLERGHDGTASGYPSL